MALVMTSGPAVEPVPLAEAKAHLRVADTIEDVLISSLVLTARVTIEQLANVAMITQAWTLVIDRWPDEATVDIPLRPLQAISAVRVKNASGAGIAIPATSYLVDLVSKPPRLIWNNAVRPVPGVPINGIEIDLSAGFGATGASVPAPLKHAILVLVAHLYENRDIVELGSPQARIPEAVADLIAPFRRIRL